jgi:hypothetical protein
MQDHISRILKGESSNHYNGKKYLDLTESMAERVHSKIISCAKTTKYFSTIAECTPDFSCVEQRSMTTRYVDITNENNGNEICEKFPGFASTHVCSGKGLTDVVLKFLRKNTLDLKHCRGQGFDSAANMKGKNSGVKKRILDQNPLAFFMSCECHNMNLVLCNAIKSSVKSIILFGALRRLSSPLAASVYGWKILTDHVKSFTFKRLSVTCREAKIATVKAVRNRTVDAPDALVTVTEAEERHDPDIAHEAVTLSQQLKDFRF